MRSINLLFGKNQKQVGGIGSTIRTLGIFVYSFHSGGEQYVIKMNIVPGSIFLTVLHKNLDQIDWTKSRFTKKYKPEEKYCKNLEMWSWVAISYYAKTAFFINSSFKYSPKRNSTVGAEANASRKSCSLGRTAKNTEVKLLKTV